MYLAGGILIVISLLGMFATWFLPQSFPALRAKVKNSRQLGQAFAVLLIIGVVLVVIKAAQGN